MNNTAPDKPAKTAKASFDGFGDGQLAPLMSVTTLAVVGERYREPHPRKDTARANRRAQNTAKASRAMALLATYAERMDSQNVEVAYVLGDLLLDLRHLADALGLTVREVQDQYMDRYREDITVY